MGVISYPPVGKILRSKVFKTSGTFTTAATCTEVYITGCGAGGGGASWDNGGATQINGGTGGVTSFGALLSLSGGNGNGVGAGSGGNGSVASSLGWGGGGFSPFSPPNAKGSLGSGGGSGQSVPGGGAGDYVYKQPLTVTPNTSYAITIGMGGLGAVHLGTPVTPDGQNGGPGYMLIEWWE